MGTITRNRRATRPVAATHSAVTLRARASRERVTHRALATLRTMAVPAGIGAVALTVLAAPAAATATQVGAEPGPSFGSATNYGTGCSYVINGYVDDPSTPVVFYDNGIQFAVAEPTGAHATGRWTPATPGRTASPSFSTRPLVRTSFPGSTSPWAPACPPAPAATSSSESGWFSVRCGSRPNPCRDDGGEAVSKVTGWRPPDGRVRVVWFRGRGFSRGEGKRLRRRGWRLCGRSRPGRCGCGGPAGRRCPTRPRGWWRRRIRLR